MISLLAYFISTHLSKQDVHQQEKTNNKPYSFDIENAKKRYSREANVPITSIKERLFERKTVKEKSAKIITESDKFGYD